jgi:branched-chain amino acid transport system substrate-binding protein
MAARNDKALMLASFLVSILFLGLVGTVLWRYFDGKLAPNPDQTDGLTRPASPIVLSDRISMGNRVLAKQEGASLTKATTRQEFEALKAEGVQAIAAQKYVRAIDKLQQSLDLNPNAPETRIYLNNAKVSEDEKTYTIAVSAPLDDPPDGLAVLRGVAQAQQEINEAGGINGIKLRVIVADDDNNGETAQQIAAELAKQQEVRGVVGHFSSSTTLAAKEVYDREQLPVVSGSSSAVDLSEKDYVFRTVPSDAATARALAEHMQGVNLKKVAVFFDASPNSKYSQSLSSTFMRETEQNGGAIVAQFDFSQAGFNATESVNQAIAAGAEAIMLAASSDNFPQVYQVIEANKGQLKLLGGDELYNITMLKNDQVSEFGKFSAGMVVGAFWDSGVTPDANNGDAQFNARAEALWNGKVNWFTAMAYDATKALAEGIKRDPSREGIYQALSDLNFSTSGAAGSVYV